MGSDYLRNTCSLYWFCEDLLLDDVQSYRPAGDLCIYMYPPQEKLPVACVDFFFYANLTLPYKYSHLELPLPAGWHSADSQPKIIWLLGFSQLPATGSLPSFSWGVNKSANSGVTRWKQKFASYYHSLNAQTLSSNCWQVITLLSNYYH